jgi:hypothetical protein
MGNFMEKGFNDQELADIMNEIESLENEMKEAEGFEQNLNSLKVSTPVGDTAISDADVDAVLADLASKELEETVQISQTTKTNNEDNIVSIQSKKEVSQVSSKAESSVIFKVEGNMSLDLTFVISGEEINLKVTEGGLVLGMESGATFNLPINSVSKKAKKAA